MTCLVRDSGLKLCVSVRVCVRVECHSSLLINEFITVANNNSFMRENYAVEVGCVAQDGCGQVS